MFIFSVQLTTCRIGNLTGLIHTLAKCVTMHGRLLLTTSVGEAMLSYVDVAIVYRTRNIRLAHISCLYFGSNRDIGALNMQPFATSSALYVVLYQRNTFVQSRSYSYVLIGQSNGSMVAGMVDKTYFSTNCKILVKLSRCDLLGRRLLLLLKKNQNAPRPSEHPPVKGKNVKTFRWDYRL